MGEQYTGELRVLQQLNKYEFAFEADILRDGPVQGGKWDFRNLDAYYRTFAGQPVLVAYTRYGKKIGDGHNSEDKIDPESGEPYRSFTAATAERIVGMISEDEADLTLIERENHTWLRVKGKIWAEYARELIEHLKLTGSMSVSVEVMVEEQREENGIEVFEIWQGIGLTILGDDVAPAVPNANIRALAAMQEEFKEMKLHVASLVKEDSEDPSDKPQESMRKGVEATMRLSKQQLRELQEKFGETHKVLAAEQGENGVDVCLMGNGGTTYICHMASVDEDVVFAKYPERIVRVNAQVHFCKDETDICVDASDMTECATEGASATAEELERCRGELAECKAALDAMKANEDKRRMAAAKKMAEDTLADFNRDREEKVEVKALEALNADIDAGKFTALCDESGMWVGDQTIQEKVLSICAKADMEYQKKLAANKAAPKEMTWGNVKKASAAPGTVGELFANR